MSASLPNSFSSVRSSKAFTLLELMVSVALLAVIIVGLLAMFSQVQRAWKSGITQVDVMEGGRATMALIVRDLQDMAALPAGTGNGTNFSANNFPEPSELDQSDGTIRTNALQDLTFLKRMGDEWSGVAYRFDSSASGVGTLYRLTGSLHRDTLTNYYTFPRNVGQLGAYLMAVDLNNYPNELTTYNGQPISPQERYYDHAPDFSLVLDGVVNFTVRAFDPAGQVLYGSRFFVPPHNLVDFICTNALDSSGIITNQFLPAYIEIELAVLEPANLARFKARAELDPTPNKQTARDYLRRKAGQVHIFRQRVPIRPAATAVGPLLPGS